MAIGAYLFALTLGLGMGAINIGIQSFFPGWLFAYIVITIVIYLTAGVFFLPNMLPSELYDIAKWSPIVQIVEMTRLAYNPQLGVAVDYLYVLGWSFGSLGLGLVMERTIVRRFL
jgi:capsular polysaccharide transport system permease protein